MPGGHLPEATPKLCEPVPDHAPALCGRKPQEADRIETLRTRQPARRTEREAVHPEIFLVKDLRRAREHAGDARTELSFQHREDSTAESIPGIPEIAVGTIPPVRDPAARQIFLEIRSRELQQGPNHTVRTLRGDSREAGTSGTPEQSKEEGLGLVVPRVTGGDVSHARVPCESQELAVTSLARPFLEVRPRSQVHPPHLEGKTQCRGLPANEYGILVGGRAPDSVVYVPHDEVAAIPGDLVHQMEQGHRVGPTGHGHDHGIDTLEHPGAAQRTRETAQKGIGHEPDPATSTQASQARGHGLPARSRSGIRLAMRSWMVILLLLSWIGVARAQDDADLPRPPDDRTRKAIVHLLRENRQQYGDDAAILQGLLLVNATRGGALLTSEVAIEGFEKRGEYRFVRFRVESGAILDEDLYDRDHRVAEVWHRILERSLLRYPRFRVPVDGIAVEVGYYHRRWESRRKLLDFINEDPGSEERTEFYLLARDIAPFVARELGGADLLRRSEILVDGELAELEVADLVGPALPDDTPAFGLLY